ncbi:MAG TPA: class I SAM-dependent methyltransferase [Tepidisphaeraceae bacterium]|nr:class I SAM-dependent methyltransferase [Tepidisphaeraceae bacterium]
MADSSDISAAGSPPKPIERFSGRAEAYLRGRPRYPQNLIPFLSEKLGLTPTHVIADVGSGTGFLTEPFLTNGNVVYAIEPNAAMRGAAESWLGKHSNFHSVNATAEATTLADDSVDFITAGQAFHWFEPTATRREFVRILRQSLPNAGGRVILVWNERRRDDPFAIEYQELVDRHSLDEPAARARVDAVEPASIEAFFAPSPCELASLPNHQDLDAQGLIDRLLSISHMPGPDHPLQDRLIEAAMGLFRKHAQNDRVRMNYNTNIFYGRL